MANYPRPLVLDNFDLRQSNVLEASAGTGKTFIIENLFVECILNYEVPPEKILVLTFTEKAALELKHRIYQLLKNINNSQNLNGGLESSWSLTDKKRKMITQAIESFGSLNIETIHSFFSQVLNDSNFLAERIFSRNEIEVTDSLQSYFIPWLRDNVEERQLIKDAIHAWIFSGRKLGNLESLLQKSLRPHVHMANQFDPKKLVVSLDRLLTLDFEEMDKVFNGQNNIHKSSIKKVLRNYKKIKNIKELWEYEKNIFKFSFLLNEIDFSSLINPRATQDRSVTWFFPDCLHTHFAPFQEVVSSIKENMTDPLNAIVSVVKEAFYYDYNEEKRRRNVITFDDMITRCVDLVRDKQLGPLVVQAMRERYQVCLVDEFQDTDSMQWEFLREIFLTSDRGHSLFIIGDPKQSIYGFRGADVGVYEEACHDIVEKGGRKESLNVNWRSSSDVVEALNALFDQEVEDPFFDSTSPINYETPVLSSGRKESIDSDDSPICVFDLVPENENQPFDAERARRTLASAIAKKIKYLIDRKVRIKNEEDERVVQFSDVFVLTRSRNEGETVAEAFRYLQIPYMFYKDDGLFQTEEAVYLRNLIKYLLDPSNQSLELQVLASPFFAVPLNSLVNHRRLLPSHPIKELCHIWREKVARGRNIELFTSLLEDSGLIRRLLYTNSMRELTNYRQLCDILIEEIHRDNVSLFDLIKKLDNWIHSKVVPPQHDRKRIETEKSAVQIMTMHASKGLEAEVVFVFGGFSKGQGVGNTFQYRQNGKLMLQIGNNSEAKKKSDAEIRQENKRLLYVSLTRAKKLLYLPWIRPEYRNRGFEQSFLRDLMCRLDAIKKLNREGESRYFKWVTCQEEKENLRKSETQKQDEVKNLKAKQFSSSIFDSLRKKHGSIDMMSYTKMTQMDQEEDRLLSSADESDSEITQLDKKESTDSPGGRQFGIFLHKIMEEIDFSLVRESNSFSSWMQQMERYFDRKFKQENFSRDHISWTAQLVYQALRAPIRVSSLHLPEGLCGPSDGLKELEFLFPNNQMTLGKLKATQVSENSFTTGSVDYAFELENRLWFVDWKSDRLRDYTSEALEAYAQRKYSLQSQLYTQAMLRWQSIKSEEAYESKWGGFLYVFLRGIGENQGVYLHREKYSDVVQFQGKLSKERFEARVSNF